MFGAPELDSDMILMEKKMETTIVYCGYIGIMENKMETTIVYSNACTTHTIIQFAPIQNSRVLDRRVKEKALPSIV